MEFQGSFLLNQQLIIIVLGFALATSSIKAESSPSHYYHIASFNRSSFPSDFIFGTASSSYQYEGAAKEDGRGPSIWDTYTHKHSERIKDGSNGDLAIDAYHRYKIVTKEDFKDYAQVCFKEFGDRVKHWITLNEPWSFSNGGYAEGSYAPGRCSPWQKRNCTGGNSATEPYLVSHHQLLSHAAAVQLYKHKYQASQKGLIGITLISHWMVPFSEAKHHKNAALRALDFMFGWYMDPLINGDYPHSMRSLVKNRLPEFTKQQSILLKGSFDFIGLNYYTANYAAYAPDHNNLLNASYLTDSNAHLSVERNGIPIGPKAASDWLYVYPRGIHELLLYIKTKYNNPVIYITENGMDELNNPKLSLKEALVDHQRIKYYYDHLYNIHRAMKVGVKVRGYFAWSLLDNFEWAMGYTVRFGINYVDYKDGLKRYPKLSARWFKHFLNS